MREAVPGEPGDVFVLRVLAAVGQVPDPGASAYIYAYDPDGMGGVGSAELTDDLARARVFATREEAFECWRAPSTVRPTRSDGRPNRPLTAYTVQVTPVRLREEPPS